MDRASQYLVFVASVLAAVQNGAVLEMTGEAAKIEFGGALTLSHNTSEDQLTCSGKIKATDVLIEGTSTTVADLIGEVAVLRQEMAAVKAFVGMMPPPASPPPSVPTYQYAGATFANGDFMNLADPTPGLDLNSYNTGQSTTNSLGFSEPPLIFQGGAVSIHASVRWMTSLGRGWYSELFTFNNVPYDTSDSGYGSNHLMIYLGTGEGGSGNTPQALCFAINDYNCQNNAVDGDQHCCVANALLPDQTNEFTFEVSAAGDRKVYRDGSLLWSQTFVGQGTLPSQTYPWLRVGGSRCCTTFPGSITDIRINSPPAVPPLSLPVPQFDFTGATFGQTQYPAVTEYLNLADPAVGRGFSEVPLSFEGGAITMQATIYLNSSKGSGWYKDLFTFRGDAINSGDSSFYGSSHLMVYLGWLRNYNGVDPLPMCFAVNDYQCQDGTSMSGRPCCADSAFTPDETNVWRFELSEAGERKMYRDGVLLFTSNGLPGLPVGNYSKLNVGNSGCCGTFPGSIKDISIWLGIP